MLYSIGYVAKFYGVSPSTIRRWEALGIISSAVRTFGGHRRFELLAQADPPKKRVGYARVSSHDHKEDLGRQIKVLEDAGCDEVISDLGSGLNCKKPGLRRLLRQILDAKVSEITLTHEDRLLRFGVDIIRFICHRNRIAIRVLNQPAAPPSFEAELAKDVITLMTVFCARLYARRSRKNTQTHNK